MTLEHLSETQLTGYSGRTLEPQELLEVDRHLASCDECHERLTRILPGVAKVTSFDYGEEPFHLDYEQHLEPYVDGKASDVDREIVESHMALCSKCATELEDLLEFKHQPVPAVADGHTSPWWKQWLPLLPLRWSPTWAVAAAGVVAVFIMGLAVLRWNTAWQAERAKLVSPEPPVQAPEKVQPSPESDPRTYMGRLPEPREEPRLVLNDAGGQLILNRSGRVEGLEELSPDLKESVERALVSGRLHASPALGWTTGVESLRGGLAAQDMSAPLEPVNVVIETDRPTFRWRPLQGTQYCVVTVYDAKLRQVAKSGPLTNAEWTVPDALQRGVTYSWQISSMKDGETIVSPKPPMPEARFRVLDQRAVTALAKLKESAGNSHLAMGVFYWKHGLLKEAEREFQSLANANPDSPVVKELLASIRSLRHH